MPSKKTIDLKKIALLNVENYMNTHISKKYIELFKNEKEIAYTQKLISRFTHAFKKRLHENKWLHEDTKKRSLKKLDNMTIVVGYKEKWEPDRAYTLDICKWNKEYYLLEANSFSCSGQYATPPAPIILEATRLAKLEWEEINNA